MISRTICWTNTDSGGRPKLSGRTLPERLSDILLVVSQVGK